MEVNTACLVPTKSFKCILRHRYLTPWSMVWEIEHGSHPNKISTTTVSTKAGQYRGDDAFFARRLTLCPGIKHLKNFC